MSSLKYPKWWSPKYSEFRADLARGKGKNLKILLTNDLMDTVTIQRHHRSVAQWEVEYTKSIPGHHGSVRVVLYMNRAEIESAFGIAEVPKREEVWCDRFGLQAGVEGVFARTLDFLSLPNPQLSSGRDLSISILLTDQMKKYIRVLVDI